MTVKTLRVRAARVLLCLAIWPLPAGGQQEPAAKPLLSDAIRQALATGGIEAAERRFKEIYPSQRDAFEFDGPALMLFGASFMKTGDSKTAQAVMNMGMAVLTVSGDDAAAPGAAPASEASRDESPAPDAGPARKDLSRFYGLYGDAGGSPRSVFVRETCNGHLQVGSLWGDVALWTMRSLSDTVFVQAFVPSMQDMPAVRIEFELGPDRKARSLRHPLLGDIQSVPRVGNLPADWAERDCAGYR